MRALYSFLLLSIFFSGCGPKIQPSPTSGPTTVIGQVFDESTNRPIPYAEVNLVSEKKGTTAMSRGTEKTVFADENGDFFISFEADADHFFILSASAQHYFADNIGTYIDPGVDNKNIHLKIQAKGYIKFNIINEGIKDTINYTIYGLFNPNIELFGFSHDTIVFREVIANKEQGISIRESTYNGFIYHGPKMISIPALDTFEYIIKY